jgi:hypothetical protein
MMPEKPIELTSEEFEALLFEVYKRGLQKGIYDGLHQERTYYTDKLSQKYFNELMVHLKLKTKIK